MGGNEIRKLHFAFALIKKEALSFLLQDTREQNNKAAKRKTCLDGFQDAGRFPIWYQAFRIYINEIWSSILASQTGESSNSTPHWPSWCLDHILSHLPRHVLVISTAQVVAATSPWGHSYFLIHLGIKHCQKLETITTSMLAAALSMSLPEARSFTYTTLVPRSPVLCKLGPVSFRRPWVSNTSLQTCKQIQFWILDWFIWMPLHKIMVTFSPMVAWLPWD